MFKKKLTFSFALLLLGYALPSYAWMAAGPRGFAHGFGGSGVAYGYHGGEAAWSHGVGVAHGPYGGTAVWSRGGYYPNYYPHYGYGGCCYSGGAVAAAGVAGLAVGAMAGSAMASNNYSTPPTTVVVEQASPAYSAPIAIGTQVNVLPGNCGTATLHGNMYYICGNNWFKPYFGNATVYYQVISPP